MTKIVEWIAATAYVIWWFAWGRWRRKKSN